MKRGEFRQGEGFPLATPADRRHDGFVQHLKDRRPPMSKERAATLKQEAEAAARKKDMKRVEYAKAKEARRERVHSGNKTPGGPAQTGGAEAARDSMIERHRQTIQENGYITPGAAMAEIMREPEGADGAAEARARMIERMEGRDGDGDKSRSLAKREPHRDSREDPLISAALRDVQDAVKARRIKPKPEQGAATAARAAMLDRMTGKAE